MTVQNPLLSLALVGPLSIGLAAQSDSQEPPILHVGDTYEGWMTDQTTRIITDQIAEISSRVVTGQTFRVDFDEPGPHYIEVRSCRFDA